MFEGFEQTIYGIIAMKIILNYLNREYEIDSVKKNRLAFSNSNRIKKYLIDYENSFIDSKVANKLTYIDNFFSLIYFNNNSISLLCDKIRSYPLFYVIEQKEIIISDDASWVYKKIDIKSYQDESIEELKQLRLVTGNDTLIESIKQVQAGEIVTIDLTENHSRPQRQFYFRYRQTRVNPNEIGKLIKTQEAIIEDVFFDIKKKYFDKKIIIPLSGGLDSRLIAAYVKKNNLNNVACFTYGNPNSHEVTISKKIANFLGFEWYFIPYSKKTWYKISNEQEFWRSIIKASNLSVMPLLQDWPAIRELKKQGRLPENSLILTGHNPAFRSYGIPHSNMKVDNVSFEKFLFFFSEAFFTQKGKLKDNMHMESVFVNKLRDYYSGGGLREFLSGFQEYKWREIASKFYASSNRLYEHFGIEWEMPFCYSQNIDFWRNIPFELIENRRLYRCYLNKNNPLNLFSENLFTKRNVKIDKSILSRAKSFYRRHLSAPIDEFMIEGALPRYKYLFYRNKRKRISVLLADLFLKQFKQRINND